MKTKYHIEITKKTLSKDFSNPALQYVITGNIRQDKIKNQFGHDYIHFDGSAFDAGFDYLKKQQQSVLNYLDENEFTAARAAFGRITHSWQDFYSHSNYVRLWREKNGNLPSEQIPINDPEIMNDPRLKSGKNYGVIEFIALLPPLSKLIKPHMPADSHARMNLDGPESGDLFTDAYIAACKQTIQAFQGLISDIKNSGYSQNKISSFLGR